MPERKRGEKLAHFMARFMRSDRMQREFPTQQQRLAVGYAEAKKLQRKTE